MPIPPPRRVGVGGVLALCVALTALSCGGAGGTTAQAGVRIVLVDAFSGPSALRGTTVRNSLQVEVDALNAGGGLLGRRVELVAADDELKPAKAAELVREHLADERVGLLVGPGATATYRAARPAIDQARVPDCLPGRIADDAAANAPYSFRTRPSDRTAVAVLLDHVLRGTRTRRLGAIAASDADTQVAEQVVSPLAATAGLEYVGATSLAGADARAAVQQLVGRGAQGLLALTDATAAAQVARAVQDLGLRDQVPVLGLGELATLAYPDQAGDAATGTTLVATIDSALTDAPSAGWPPAYRAFVQSVAARYGYATNGREIKGVPEAAECVRLWASAVRRAGSLDGAQVVSAWEGLRVAAGDAVLGVPEQFTPGQHDAIGASGVFLYRWARKGAQYRLERVT
jgi:branched-chain amino acid transport system substrate-binding protein